MSSLIRANRAILVFPCCTVLTVGGFLAPRAVAQHCWIERVPPLATLPPHGSDSVGMAFDSGRNVAVLFEYDPSADATRTLEWDGANWHEREMGTGPSRRYGFRMVYDPIRQVTMFFGGAFGWPTSYFGDTWVWDGVQWTQVSNTGPSPRYAHSMAWDPRHGGVLLQGGVGGSEDTWLWNGTAWTLRSAEGPSGIDAAMAFDEVREEMVLFGGESGSSDLNDTWIWNMNSWSLRSSTGPGRARHSMVFFNGTIFVFGGDYQNQVLDDVWTWDGSNWSEVMASGPSARRLCAMTVDTQRQRVVVFGGRGSLSLEPLFDDTWEWDGTQWKEMPWIPGFQSLRAGLAYDSFRRVTMLFGGSGGRPHEWWEDEDLSDDLSQWDGNQWKKVAHSGPVARQRFAMAYRPYPTQPGGFLIIQGGEDPSGDRPQNDYSIYAGTSWGNSSSGMQTAPGNAMVFDTWRDNFVMYDGWTRLFPLMGGWTIANVANPPYRTDHAMAFDSERGVAVLFGGVNFNGVLHSDTWEWDGSAWTFRSTVSGPSPRKFHAMAYDEVLKKTILFGGEGASGDLGDTWAWDGTTWEEMAISGPSARSGHRMAYDSNRDRIVLFGGQLGSTWEFASSCPSGFNNRFLTISSEGIFQPTALRVTLTSLHHPDAANGAPDFSAFEGQVRWAGPAVLENESSSNPAVMYASFLQCSPHYQLWTPSRLLQLTGSAIVPSSKYQVEWLGASCAGQESTCPDILQSATFITTRWGDIVPPFRPPSNAVQPDISDVSALVDKFRSVPGAPVKAQALLAGPAPFGNVNIAVDVDFAQVSACVDAFRGMPYPYAIEACP